MPVEALHAAASAASDASGALHMSEGAKMPRPDGRRPRAAMRKCGDTNTSAPSVVNRSEMPRMRGLWKVSSNLDSTAVKTMPTASATSATIPHCVVDSLDSLRMVLRAVRTEGTKEGWLVTCGASRTCQWMAWALERTRAR